MAILHTVNKSPFERNSLESCLRFATDGAAVLLFEDGIYAALSGTSVEAQVAGALDKLNIHVLGPDLKARGFSEERVIAGISVVDYAGFVDLTAEHDTVQAWL
ncbi:sulfurtransferase complex subunit TusB [Thiocystis violascens]|uniref:Sulfur relay protein TusB/DsrH n=1 Tax=Thiocystis violascens (strain ATCC 17096 / DSM 198 / 6111) TaxID=765911 RepID=I3Y6I9_THIV6|nr:sulfurtransferase complex subunit TusB [Thiocystis violascens]AFL72607.1 sulfur relay protein TusB/DsrH [Thiocystis violascens DSM 198]